MSRTYDNWERLVAAVLKREELRQLCREPSKSLSASPLSSGSYPSPYSPFDETVNHFEGERIDEYEPGVYITLLVHTDGTREVKRARFSSKIFKRRAAEKWWLDNREQVYEKYNDQIGLDRIKRLSVSGQGEDSLDKSRESCESSILISQYKPGVYIFLAASRDGSTEFKQVCFSQRKFKEHEAKAWWLKNRKKVYEKHNVQDHRLDKLKQPLVSTQDSHVNNKTTKHCCLGLGSFKHFLEIQALRIVRNIAKFCC